jgi:MSHA biogenesis protein MshK
MDEAVNHLRYLATAAILCLAQANGHAEGLQDPTRPPPLLAPRADGTTGSSRGPQLQSVLIARQPGGRHVAVIDGDTVRLGDSYKGARVTRIAQTEVELVRGGERQVLKLPSPTDDASVQPIARLQ